MNQDDVIAQARESVARTKAELGTVEQQLQDLARRLPAAVVFAMLEVLVVAQAGRPEFVDLTKLRVYRAVIENLASKGIR